MLLKACRNLIVLRAARGTSLSVYFAFGIVPGLTGPSGQLEWPGGVLGK